MGDAVRAEGRILVVDDAEASVALLRRLLTRDGHIVLTAASGEEALQVIAREAPDLVLLDVLMPNLNGYQVCQLLKETRRRA